MAGLVVVEMEEDGEFCEVVAVEMVVVVVFVKHRARGVQKLAFWGLFEEQILCAAVMVAVFVLVVALQSHESLPLLAWAPSELVLIRVSFLALQL